MALDYNGTLRNMIRDTGFGVYWGSRQNATRPEPAPVHERAEWDGSGDYRDFITKTIDAAVRRAASAHAANEAIYKITRYGSRGFTLGFTLSLDVVADQKTLDVIGRCNSREERSSELHAVVQAYIAALTSDNAGSDEAQRHLERMCEICNGR